MGCSPFDLKDYFFGELPADGRHAVDEHLASCARCREELESLELTRSALLAVPDEEPPRRIGFVSDKVFEQRWWQRLWASGPGLGFASAAMLSAAILVHTFAAKPVTVVQQAPAAASTAKLDTTAVENEVARRVQIEITKAVAASEARQTARLAQIQADQRRNREDLLSVGDSVSVMKRSYANLMRASIQNEPGATQ